jgi:hypothetical protein
MADLLCLRMWRVPRCYFCVAWRDVRQLQLEGFVDTSGSGYGSCVYVRAQMPDDNFQTSLVMSKARVAPVKALTMPQLELMAALLCARLISFVYRELKHPDINSNCGMVRALTGATRALDITNDV